MEKNKRKKVTIVAVILIAITFIFVFNKNVFVNFRRLGEQIGNSTITDQNQTMYIFTVRYMYERTGKVALNKDVYCFDKGETIDIDVHNIDGYTPSEERIYYEINDNFISTMQSLDKVKIETQEGFPNIYKIYYTVSYEASASSYKVNIYKQEVQEDGSLEYGEPETETFEDNVFIGDIVETEADEIEGYTLDTEKSNLNAEVKQKGADLNLYYNLNQHYLFFDTDGGTNQDAVSIYYGENVQTKLNGITSPTKSGYNFNRWECLDNEETSSRATTPEKMPDSDLFFRAIYDEGQASYTIIYFLENANDDNYTNIGTYIVGVDGDEMVTTGTNIHNISDIHTIIDNGMKKLKPDEFQFFTRNEEKSHESLNENVLGDGTTVVKVYYDRKVYTINFMISRETVSGRSTVHQIATNTNGSVDGASWHDVSQASTMIVNGETYKDNEYSITAKYNETILDKWPVVADVSDNGSYHFISWGTDANSEFYKTHNNKNILGRYFNMSSELIIDPNNEDTVHTLVAYWATSTYYYRYHYMFENIDQSNTANSEVYDGKYYTENRNALVRSTNTRVNQNGPDAWGLTLVGKSYDGTDTAVGGSNSDNAVDIYFYYDRNKYEITFNNLSQDYIPSDHYIDELSNHGIYRERNQDGNYKIYAQYGANLSILENAWEEWELDEDNPFEYPVADEGNIDWNFNGWYYDPEYDYPVDWENLEINQNLTLYAKWDAPRYTVTFDVNQGNWRGGTSQYDTAEKGKYKRTVVTGTKMNQRMKPTDPYRAGYTFLGWYYTNDEGQEIEYTFNDSQIVAHNLTLTAKWETRSEGSYTVRYYEAKYDDAGNLITDTSQYGKEDKILNDKTVSNVKYNTTVTEEAAAVGQEGFYFVDKTEKSLVVTTDSSNNVINFFYTPLESMKYRVYYVLDDGTEYKDGEVPPSEKQLAPHKDGEFNTRVGDGENYDDIYAVTEEFKELDGYQVDAYKKFLVLTTDKENTDGDNNAIYFYYKKVENKGKFRINYYFMDYNGGYPSDPDYVYDGEDSVGTQIHSINYEDYLAPDSEDGLRLYPGHEFDREHSDILMIVITTEGTAELHLYFKTKEYSVTYDTVDGQWNDESDIYTELTHNSLYEEKVQYQHNATRPTEPTKEGYRFVDWYDSSTDAPYNFDTQVTQDTQLYAKWVEIKDISITKEWYDEEDQDGKRPDDITVYLKKDGEEFQTLNLYETQAWTTEVTDLDAFDLDGNPITYTVEEKTVDGYNVEYEVEDNNYIIKNTHTPEKKNILITKIWQDNNDQDGLRPESINIDLRADGVLDTTVNLSDANGWKQELTDKDVYKNGNPIVYTIDEEETTGYTTTVEEVENGFNVTNTHDVEKTSLSVNKQWQDNNNQDGMRTGSVQVNLKANGLILDGYNVTLDDQNGWSYTWNDIDVYSGGEPIDYEVEEVEITGYTPQYSFNGDTNTWTITNVHEPQTKNINVNKVWVDDSDRDGLRTESVEIELLRDGVRFDDITLDDSNSWNYTFEDLDVYENGVPCNYSINEVNVPDGYTQNVTNDGDNYTVTNTHIPQKVSRTVKKIWRDGSNKEHTRPDSIKFRLLKNGQPYSDEIVLNATNQGDNSDEWVYTFDDLYVYEDGEEITYTVEELEVPEQYGVIYNQKKLYIYNAYPPEFEVSVEKIWNDEDDADGIRPQSIGVQLYANGQPYQLDGQNVGYAELTAENGWEHIWDFVEKYDENGEKYEYTLEEVYVGNENYSSQIRINNNENPDFQRTYIIENTYVPNKTSRTVTKVWNDENNQDGKRPDNILIELLANGSEVAEATINDANGWKYTFDNINVNQKGQPIDYTVKEVMKNDEFYTSNIEYNDENITITNTHTPETKQINVTKEWDDAENQDGIRPSNITFSLMKNGVSIGEYTLSDGNWSTTIPNLPVYEAGAVIDYSIVENEVTGYNTRYEVNGNDITIVNEHAPEKIDLKINKEWVDDLDRDGLRATNVHLTLKANGVPIKENIVLNRTVNWQTTISQLDKNEAGSPIEYSVEEIEVPNYTTEYIVDKDNNTITVKNTHTPQTKPITIVKEWEDEQDLYGKRPDDILVDIYANGDFLKTVTLEEATSWQIAVGGLFVNEGGTPIEYSIKEHESDIYTDSVEKVGDTYTITNTINTYIVKTRVNGTGGDISGNGLEEYERVAHGDTNKRNIKITPEVGYKISKITINNVEQDLPDDCTQEYVLPNIENITEDKEVVVEFSRIEYEITTEVVNGHGQISGMDEDVLETVYHGDDSKEDIVITPDYGYEIKSLKVNGVEQEIPDDITYPYTLDKFRNVESNIHIEVEFKRIEAKVVTSYKDTKGQTILPDEVIDTYIGETYTTNSKQDELDKYVLVEIQGDTTGIVDEEEIHVTYVYEYRPDLHITKTVKGTYADIDKVFDFKVELVDDEGQHCTKKLDYEIQDAQGNIVENSQIENGELDLKLSNGQKISIYKVPVDTIYTVSELGAEDYITTINGNEAKDKSIMNSLNDDTVLDFVNEKDYIAPTGIMFSVLPFGIGIIIVVSFIVYLKKMKKNKRTRRT